MGGPEAEEPTKPIDAPKQFPAQMGMKSPSISYDFLFDVSGNHCVASASKANRITS